MPVGVQSHDQIKIFVELAVWAGDLTKARRAKLQKTNDYPFYPL